ncbi:hypothetical protein HG547_10110 [Shewanella sp. DNRA4]|uniref:O-antigen ligase family protein n=1 Tax=Shewanella sp. DNRA4 TaxID=2723055 RepID=UPI00146A72AC|nr:O-antigen ligase family protein [Shewanella sp. DNRA4]NMD51979.1 hypothetical protein [Shewanella sp. DNRA4]
MYISSKYLTWIFYSFLPFCLIDVMNGYFSFHGIGIPLSQLYKAYILLLLLPILIKNYFAINVALFLLLGLFYQSSFYTISFSEDVAVLMRNAIFIFSVLAFYQTRGLLTYLHFLIIKKVFIVNFLVISFSVLSGILGFGLTTYGNNLASIVRHMGFKGYFYAGNELGALLMCIFPFVVFSFESKTKKVSVIFLALIVAASIGTKTALLSVFLISVLMFFYYLHFSRLTKFLVVFIFAILTLVSIFVLISLLEKRFDILTYVYEERGIIYLILSGRDVMLLNAKEVLIDNFTLMDYVFGVGSSYAAYKVKSVEIDFADILIWNGVLWMLFVHLFYIVFSYYVTHLLPKKEKFIAGFMFMLILFASTTAGHVLTSGMLLPLISLTLSYGYAKKYLV